MAADHIPPPARVLTLRTRLFYGFGSIAFGVKESGFNYFLLIFYNQVMGLTPRAVGLAVMIALMIDAFLDPIVGQASDNLRSRWGRRHPFMYAAALPAAVSFLLLWNPPDWGPQALFFYLIVVAVVIRSCITLYEIPSAALAAELTQDYDERTRLLSYRYLFGWIGGLATFLAAFLVFLKPEPGQAAGQLRADGYGSLGLAAAGLMFVAIVVSSLGTHNQIPFLKQAPERKLSIPMLMREMVGTLAHASFLRVLGASLFAAMANGLVLSINLYFNTYFWELPPGDIAKFAGASLAAAVLAFMLAPRLSRRFGKKRSAMTAMLVSLTAGGAPIILRLLDLAPPNGDPLLLPILLAQNTISTACSITASVLTSSMIADVVEDSELRTGRRSEGLFFSAAAFVAKAVSGIGIFTSGMMLAVVGFPQDARPGEVPPEVVANLGVAFVPTLAALYGMAVLFMSGYRITREGHAESLRRLAAAADLTAEGEPPASGGRLS